MWEKVSRQSKVTLDSDEDGIDAKRKKSESFDKYCREQEQKMERIRVNRLLETLSQGAPQQEAYGSAGTSSNVTLEDSPYIRIFAGNLNTNERNVFTVNQFDSI